jgi:hypothetical protein
MKASSTVNGDGLSEESVLKTRRKGLKKVTEISIKLSVVHAKITMHKWDGNIEMDVKGIGVKGAEWINVVRVWDRQRAFVNTTIDFWFHKILVISWLCERTISFSRNTLFHGFT